MKLIATGLSGAWILEPQVHLDHRGFFSESYSERSLREHGIECSFVQDNHSMSVEAETLRGLHFQAYPKAQTKLIRVASGVIYDVAIDIRPNSPTFGRWIGVILSSDNNRQLFIPKGFAHGFCTLVANTHVLYKVDEYYSKEQDGGIAWDDPDLGILWPSSRPILSDKDRVHPRLRDSGLVTNKGVNAG